MAGVHYFNEKTRFTLPNPRKTTSWIKKVIEAENCTLGDLNYIFCSDKYLLSINQQYLKHNTFTDIITFGLGEPGLIEGDIYISIPRVRENARLLGKVFEEELHRVIIHGVLHLAGYSDKIPRKKALMRKKEDASLSLR